MKDVTEIGSVWVYDIMSAVNVVPKILIKVEVNKTSSVGT